MNKQVERANGFSMIELLFATVIFTVIAGTVFSLLLSSQWRYQNESSLTEAFQQANLVIDQIARDIHSAGYPPASSFSSTAASQYFAVAFPWSPSYPGTPCNLGACTTPGDTELILEEDVGNGTGVQWIRYSLNGTTLQRGSMTKAAGDPLNQSWTNNMTPYLENVVNPSSVPIFRYLDSSGNLATQLASIREVNICLMVQSAKPDPQTGQSRTITLTGQAVRFNPNQ
jgi:prepilin-type N-terminal cleavage/methylation domain-containing protein